MGKSPERQTGRLGRAVALKRRTALFVLLFERFWPALWPPLGLIGAFVIAALLGLPPLLPPRWQLGLLLALALSIFALLTHGLSRLSWPKAEEADRWLERVSGLAHQPLAVLADQSATSGAAAAVLWEAHRARARAALGRLRLGRPHPELAARDPLALRVALVVGLVAALVIAGAEAPQRLARALVPPLLMASPASAIGIAAWVTPPAYTGLAPILLASSAPEQRVPAGSTLSVAVTGSARKPQLTLTGRPIAFSRLDQASFRAEARLTESGPLVVGDSGRRLAFWWLDIVADRPPTAEFTAPPSPVPNQGWVRLPWQVADDYGVVSLKARFRLLDRPEAAPRKVPIELPEASPRAAQGLTIEDLWSNPWAGLKVTAQLIATDATGQQGTSSVAELTLPAPYFTNPLARALLRIRRRLALDPFSAPQAAGMIERLAARPQLFHSQAGPFLIMSATAALLRLASPEDAVPQAEERLWLLALQLEEGRLGLTAEALRQARRGLAEALARHPPDPPAVRQALRRLEQALARHLAALTEAMQQSPAFPSAQKIDESQLARLMRALRDDLANGRIAAARRDWAALQVLFAELIEARPAGPADRAAAARAMAAQTALDALQDVLHRQAGLLDRLARRAGGTLSPKAMAAAQQGDAATEQALRQAVRAVGLAFAKTVGEVLASLGRAGQEMEAARQALRAGDDPAADPAERAALAALAQAERSVAGQMARRFGSGRILLGSGEGESTDGEQPGHDPLGRQIGNGGAGADESNSVRVPTAIQQTEVRRIERELHRRSADPTLSPADRDYIRRLLEPFSF